MPYSNEILSPNIFDEKEASGFKSVVSAMFDKFPAMVWISDITSSMVYFNGSWLDFTGKTLKEELGFGWKENLHPKDANTCIGEYVSAFNSRTIYEQEFRLKHKSGEYRWIRVTAWPFNGSENVFYGYLGFCYDITDQKIREIVSSDREAYYRALIENISDIITIVTENETVIFCSASTKKIMNYSPDELVGKTYSQCVHYEDMAVFKNAFYKALASPATPVSVSYRFINKNGEYCNLESIMNNMLNDEAVNGIIINSRDVTARVKMETDLKCAMAMADSANLAKSQFIANVSHEIRTPLNSIAGFVNLLSGSELSPKQSEYASYIKKGCEVLISLVNNVLDFSKIEAQKIEIDEIDFKLSELTNDVITLTRQSAAANGVSTNVYIDENIGVSLTGDYKKLRQILLNLVSNAIKFTKNGEVKIEIKLCCYKNDKTFVTFNVIDNGIGMSSEQVEKIFKPFDQARPEISRIYGGTGLGLHISNQLVKLLNGEKISVESAIDKGSKFYFTLPFTAKSETTARAKTAPGFKIEKNIDSYEILIVEDNLINYILVEELLKKMGHRPHKAEDGHRAVELVKKNRYDIIFMDIQMPGIDGYEATRQIRTTDREVPIVAMTANAIRGDYERCIESGMNDYLSKPIEIEKFNDIILRYVKNRTQSSSEQSRPAAQVISVSAPESVLIFDHDKFVKNTFSNDSLAKDIIKIFFEDIEKYRKILKDAIEKKDSETLFKSAHRLKGSAANVCAPCLKQAFLSLETAGRESRFEDATGFLELLGREIDIFKTEIKKHGYDYAD